MRPLVSGELGVGILMKKLGIYGIISGSLTLSLIIGLTVLAYFRGLWNLRKFGGEIYIRDLLFNVLVETWWAILYLLVFSIISIILGILLSKENLRALKLWVGFYGIIAVSCLIGIIMVGITFSIVEFVISTLILVLSIRVLNKINGDSNNGVQRTPNGAR